MTTARLNIRIFEQLKTKAIKPAVLSGHKNLADYVTSVVNEHSTEVKQRIASRCPTISPFGKARRRYSYLNLPPMNNSFSTPYRHYKP